MVKCNRKQRGGWDWPWSSGTATTDGKSWFSWLSGTGTASTAPSSTGTASTAPSSAETASTAPSSTGTASASTTYNSENKGGKKHKKSVKKSKGKKHNKSAKH